ncbi:MAG: DEAD/DEAH box helicase [Candidatus Hodarchaeales archaeon]
MTPNHKSYAKFANHLTRKVITRASGLDTTRVYGLKPSKKYFVGIISPLDQDVVKFFPGKLMERSYPNSFGLVLLIPKNTSNKKLAVKFNGSIYYCKVPTLAEQKGWMNRSALEENEDDNEIQIEDMVPEEDELVNDSSNIRTTSTGSKMATNAPNPTDQTKTFSNEKAKIVFVYQKIVLKDTNIAIPLSNLTYSSSPSDFKSLTVTKSAIEEAIEVANNDPRIWRHHLKGRINISEVETENDFENQLRLASKKRKEEYKSEWDFDLEYCLTDDVDEDPKYNRLKLRFVNKTQKPDKWDDSREPSFFETKLTCNLEGFEIKNFPLNSLKGSQFYDTPNIAAYGHNCTATSLDSNTLVTEHTPIYNQYRLKSQETNLSAFDDLINDPVSVLSKLADKMGDYYKEQIDQMDTDNLESIEQRRLQDIKIQMGKEEKRFREGLKLIKNNSTVRESFILMNKTFRDSSKGFSTWRLFQIVFITMLIPDIVSEEDDTIKHYRDEVDLIFFPTGGGKTEAYLGIVIFQIFFDRFRGKKSGISVFTRFPLRLLSLQQIQRITDILGAAELLRRKHPIIGSEGYDQFSVGYYVGNNNTPNMLYKNFRGKEENNISIINDQENVEFKNRLKIISICPFCHKKTVDLIGDFKAKRIRFSCTSCNEEIPVFISDEEVYRYLPTFVVATLDKVAICGYNRHFRHIFNQVTGICPEHGYLSGDRCIQKFSSCEIQKYKQILEKIPPPSLFIQDEIHLVRESLGTYASHYETFILNYSETVHPKNLGPKIIGATATISQFRDQIKEIYCRKGNAFPSQSLKQKQSFYSYEDQNELARIIVGVMPRGKTLIFSVLDILSFYYQEIQEFESDPRRILQIIPELSDQKEAEEIIDAYKLMLAYNISKLEGDQVTHSIESQVNMDLHKIGLRKINVRSLTGDVSFGDVREVLDIIESPVNFLDLITATSMISHGVDIDSLNFMAFRGMPRSTSEYIQAFSRVGRKYPGIIFVNFNYGRERDVSYYQYFKEFHDYKDHLIDPVPVKRWGKFAIERTLPGIFIGALQILFEPRINKKEPVRLYRVHGFCEAYRKNYVRDVDVIDFIKKSYKPETSPNPVYFKEIIEEKVTTYISSILSNRFKADANTFQKLGNDSPMLSLRDIDVLINVTPNPSSYDLFNRFGTK